VTEQENTTASEQTTETTPATETVTTEAPGSSATSTTEETTLLTAKPGEEVETTEVKEETTEEAAPNEFHGAPEGDYEEPTLPEGVTLDTEAYAALVPVAKELGLSQAGLQKVIDLYATNIMPKASEQVVTSLQNDIAAQHAAWATEAKEMVQTDEVFAGQKLDAVLATSAKAIDRFGGPEFRKFLQDTGLGNHPAMVRMSYLAGTAIAEDTTFERGGAAPTEKSRTEKYYGRKNA